MTSNIGRSRSGRLGIGRQVVLLLLALAASACSRQEPAPLGRVAYVRGDTLFVQALPEGRARAVTVGRRLATPRWSPSGDWLAFRRNDSLRLERSDGAIGGLGGGGQTLAGPEATAFAWAPGDDRLAYVGGGNLVVARAGGMAVALVERTRDAAVGDVAWSQDGAWLEYGTSPTDSAAPTARPGLWRIPARGGAVEGLPPSARLRGSPAAAAAPEVATLVIALPRARALRPELVRFAGDARHVLVAGTDSTGVGSLWLVVPGKAGRRIETGLRPPTRDSAGARVAWGEVMDYWPGPPSRRAPASGR